MSFKSVKWRKTIINFNKINNVRTLFTVKYLKETLLHIFMININQPSLNRDVKTWYSWGTRGKLIETKNVSFTGSISWIWAIWSYGS